MKFKSYHKVIMLFIHVPHPFSIVLKRFYCSQEVLSKIPKPIENNRKWVWWVYKGELQPLLLQGYQGTLNRKTRK